MHHVSAEPPPFFHRGPSPLARLAFFGLLSIALMFADTRFRYLEGVRQVVAVALYPVEMAGEARDKDRQGRNQAARSVYLAGMRAKLGLTLAEPEDESLGFDLLDQMHHSGADYTTSFRLLCDVAEGKDRALLRSRFTDTRRFDEWCDRWRLRATRERTLPAEQAQMMRRVNPAFIPRNHLVEQALKDAMQRGDLSTFDRLAAVLARPYDDQPEHAGYAEPPPSDFGPYRTFCGT